MFQIWFKTMSLFSFLPFSFSSSSNLSCSCGSLYPLLFGLFKFADFDGRFNRGSLRSNASTDWKEISPNETIKITIMEKPALTTQVTAGCKPLTTFVQTDTNSFREVVQRLTGPSEPNDETQQEVAASAGNNKTMGLTRPKLHERRQYMRPKLEIVKPTFHFRPPSSPTTDQNQACSPSKVGHNNSGPSLISSPLGTPSTIMSKLNMGEENNEKGESVLNSQEEEKAIKERRFYLHPSPRGRPGYTEPELLTLFPLTSPGSTEKNHD